MDARVLRLALVVAAISSTGATFRSPNFVVTAPTQDIAQQVAETAERCRDELAVAWLGKPLSRWYRPCQVTVKVGQLGAGGATTFAFDQGEVFGWRMTVQGSLERVLDSVIPHEVSHTILATHFRRPLPRWADEGAATLVEHESEQHRQRLLLRQVWKSSRHIPLRELLSMTEYPSDMQSVMTLYAEGYSLADFLVQAGGRAKFLEFLEDAHRRGWDAALQEHYSLSSTHDLEHRWTGWVEAGSPALQLPEGQQLADADRGPRDDVVIRSQSPDPADERASARPERREREAALETPFVAPASSSSTATGHTAVAERDAFQHPVNRDWAPATSLTRSRSLPRGDAKPPSAERGRDTGVSPGEQTSRPQSRWSDFAE
ncbi:MAG TPA: hypothetical protein VML55_00545 [Planctomycetaceae bacterium]|nr:hypothetical protein [Planctomycetaceae bacterium]